MLVIEYIMYTKFRSHITYTDKCVLIIMYCLGIFVLFTVNNIVYKQISMTMCI